MSCVATYFTKTYIIRSNYKQARIKHEDTNKRNFKTCT